MINFENRDEITDPGASRPEEFSWKKQHNAVIELSDAQEKALVFAKKAVLEHLKGLGIQPKHDFDIDRIIFQNSSRLLEYAPNTDIIVLPEYTEASLHSIIHELLHAYSSQYRNQESDSSANTTQKNKTSVPSGFHVNHYKKGFNNEATSVNFRNINEAVTEKITREIATANASEIQILKENFTGRAKEMLEKYYGSTTNLTEEQIAEQVQHIIQESTEEQKRANRAHEQETDQINRALSDKKISETEHREQIIEANSIWRQTIRGIQIHYRLKIKALKLENKFDAAHKAQILEFYSPDEETESYQGLIEILDTMIEKIAEKKGLTTATVWEELQKAYFAGTLMHLRIFNEVFGPDTLRKLDGVIHNLPLSVANFKKSIK